MKLNVKFLQAGGQMPEEAPAQAVPAEGGAPAPEGAQGGDPMQQILDVVMQLGDMAAKALQSNDPQAMGQVCQGLAQFASELAQQMGGGQAPVFKKGGKVVKKKMMVNPKMAASKKC